jgi:transposase
LQRLLHEFAQHDQDPVHLLVMDHGRGQKATARLIPTHGGGLFGPPESPERNPIARRWAAMKAHLAWALAAAIEALAHQVATMLRHDSQATIPSLTADPDVARAGQALGS